MRPIELPHGLFVPEDVAAVIAPLLVRELAAERRLGAQVHPDVVETIEKLDLLGEGWRNAKVPKVPQAVPTLDTPRSEPTQSITVKTAADTLGITERAVTKRIATGSLVGRKVRGAWLVDLQSIRALQEVRP